jgi:hypothetical protein
VHPAAKQGSKPACRQYSWSKLFRQICWDIVIFSNIVPETIRRHGGIENAAIGRMPKDAARFLDFDRAAKMPLLALHDYHFHGFDISCKGSTLG